MKSLIVLVVTLMATSSWARLTLPSEFIQLEGAFKGVGMKTKRTAHILVYKIMEPDASGTLQPSGRFNIFLLTNDRTQGQILEAESVGGTGIAVLVDGTNSNQKYIEAKLPPAGLLELALDKKYGQFLKLSRQDNSLLAEDYAFTEDSDDIRVNPNNPTGLFNMHDDSVSGTAGPSGTLNVAVEAPSLSFSGKFVGIFELNGVMVLRKQKLDNNLSQYSEGEISGLLVSIYIGKKPMVIVGTLSDGRPVPVKVLPLD